MICTRCRNRFYRKDGYGHVSTGRGEDALDQLRSFQQWEVCGSCAESLKTFLGFLPQAPVSQPEPEPPLPTAPITCNDSRLDYS